MNDGFRLAHIGIAVADMEKAIDVFTRLLGSKPSQISELAAQKVKIAFFPGMGGSGDIELVAPLGEGSTVKKFIQKNGEGLHHLCIKVSNIDAKLKELAEQGYRLIDDNPRIGAGGHKIAFIHPSSLSGVLVELEEE
ncbi:MAG: methylmalonyl-CoA epimerase [candidate division Zixibacteria bacterium]|nr:methylmalonyl-CoA epimerase [candidate division Zixibacteria bacterium]